MQMWLLSWKGEEKKFVSGTGKEGAPGYRWEERVRGVEVAST